MCARVYVKRPTRPTRASAARITRSGTGNSSHTWRSPLCDPRRTRTAGSDGGLGRRTWKAISEGRLGRCKSGTPGPGAHHSSAPLGLSPQPGRGPSIPFQRERDLRRFPPLPGRNETTLPPPPSSPGRRPSHRCRPAVFPVALYHPRAGGALSRFRPAVTRRAYRQSQRAVSTGDRRARRR